MNVAELYLNEWGPSQRDRRLHDLAALYHAECECYDRTVCTGPTRNGVAMPNSIRELATINRNAHIARKNVEECAMKEGFSNEELSRAIGKLSRW